MKRLTERLGDKQIVARGSLALCYRAREAALDRMVFVKALHPDVSADADLRGRFVREARALARLDHPHVVRLYEFGEDPEFGLYMMLEYVEGITLAERLRSGQRLPTEEIRRLAEHLFAGLNALHEAGIVHRDLKPGNILLRADGIYKITDFSLAALRDEPKLTHHRAIVGTPAYMSPEQAAGLSPDAKSDLFAAGVVLFESVTGTNPFACEDMLEAMRRVRQVEPAFNSSEMQALPDELRETIRACLEKERSHRPQSAAEALQFIGYLDVSATATGKTRRRERAAVAWTLTALIVGIVVVVFILRGRSPERFETKPSADSPEETLQEIIADSITALENSIVTKDSIRQEPAAFLEESHPVQRETTAREETPQASANEIQTASVVETESTDVYLEIIPWAHVYRDGRRLGTTPMRQPLRLPIGEQTLTFRNPAFPEISLRRPLRAGVDSLKMNLADYVMTLDVSVDPWGDIYVDGELAGSSPLGRALYFRPGAHTIRVTHPNLATVEKNFEAIAGDTILASANLDRGELVLRHRRDTVP